MTPSSRVYGGSVWRGMEAQDAFTVEQGGSHQMDYKLNLMESNYDHQFIAGDSKRSMKYSNDASPHATICPMTLS